MTENHSLGWGKCLRSAAQFFVPAATLVLAACGTPKGTLTYYLPKAETAVKVSQSLACNTAGDHLIQVVSVTAATTYLSGTDADSKVEFEPSAVDGWVANADIAFSFTEDGRLSGVNTTSVGQGGEILKDVIAVAKVAAAAGAPPAGATYDAKKACKVIADYSAKKAAQAKKDAQGKPVAANADDGTTAQAVVTLNYAARFDYKNLTSGDTVKINGADPLGIPVEAASATLFADLQLNIPTLGFYAKVATSAERNTPTWSATDAKATIKLAKVARTTIEVRGAPGDLNNKDLASFWQGDVSVPLSKSTFAVPIPSAAVFGTRKFVLALSDDGSITKLEYSTTDATSGASSALSALGTAVISATKAPTSAQKAASVQSDADLIYENQRKALCMAKPESCTQK